MGNLKHTPGPWIVGGKSKDGRYIIERPDRNDGTPFTSWWVGWAGPCTDHDKENAILMAAAPELLEALTNLLEHNPVFRSKHVGAPGSDARVAQDRAIHAENKARALIAEIHQGAI